VVLEVKTDPEVPPLPPHISIQEARNFVTMLAKGDEREGNILKDTARQVLSSILPGSK
jgi:pyruvate dehydrogenase (quinone)